MVNSQRDDGFTRKHLSHLLELYSSNKQEIQEAQGKKQKHNCNIQIMEMDAGFSWTNALNLAMLTAFTENSCCNEKIDFIFNISVEALFTIDQFHQMLKCFDESKSIIAVGTTFKPVYPNGISLPLSPNQITTLGKSYNNPRNTGMLVRISSLQKEQGDMCYFDSFCDNINGMEDFDWLVRLIVLHPDLEFKMLDLKVDLLIGINFNQQGKEQREMDAIEMIIKRWKMIKNTKTEQRIENAISKLIANLK
jgi:hypothetical protein